MVRFSLSSLSITLLSLTVASVLGGPTPLITVQLYDGPKKANSYIVTLKPGASPSGVAGNVPIAYQYTEVLNGFAATLDPVSLVALRASPNVESIAEDGIMSINEDKTQTNAPWGLSRVSASPPWNKSADAGLLTYEYKYDGAAGQDVTIYIIDTGARVTHTDFGGRVTMGPVFGGYPAADGNGHGTHVAGTAVGTQYGIAKAAKVIALKVLSDAGSGAISDIIAAMDHVVTDSKGSPSVVSMSLGGTYSQSLNDAVKKLTDAGIHVVVAAGNSNTFAETASPASAPSAITVGASTVADEVASFSNYGKLVDVFAPGQDVISAWNTDDTATNKISGTSMATPHVSGLVAYLISKEGNCTPADMSEKLKKMATTGALTRGGSPLRTFLFFSLTGTANTLVHN